MDIDIEKLGEIVTRIADEELLPRFTRVASEVKADGSLVTEADLVMQQRLTETLRKAWPDIPLVGEETPEKEQQRLFALADHPIWCLDPLDGTTNFAAGIPFFGVSLALLVNRLPVISAVYDPVRRELFCAEKDRGAWLNGTALQADGSTLPLKNGVGVVDFKRLHPDLATRLATQPPYSSQRSFGSVALDWCWLAANRFQVYLHGKQKVWDYAAGWLILNEAGGRSTTLQGEEVFTPELTPRSAVAAFDQRLYEEWYAWLTETDTKSM